MLLLWSKEVFERLGLLVFAMGPYCCYASAIEARVFMAANVLPPLSTGLNYSLNVIYELRLVAAASADIIITVN